MGGRGHVFGHVFRSPTPVQLGIRSVSDVVQLHRIADHEFLANDKAYQHAMYDGWGFCVLQAGCLPAVKLHEWTSGAMVG